MFCFCTMKETIGNVKRQPSEWEKTTANETTDEELISKIYKGACAAQYQKIEQPNQKVGKRLRHFSKGDMQMDNKHMKKMLNITHYSVSSVQSLSHVRLFATP